MAGIATTSTAASREPEQDIAVHWMDSQYDVLLPAGLATLCRPSQSCDDGAVVVEKASDMHVSMAPPSCWRCLRARMLQRLSSGWASWGCVHMCPLATVLLPTPITPGRQTSRRKHERCSPRGNSARRRRIEFVLRKSASALSRKSMQREAKLLLPGVAGGPTSYAKRCSPLKEPRELEPLRFQLARFSAADGKHRVL